LLLSHPDPAHLRIVPTTRDLIDGLALSSRNVYLVQDERKVAGALYAALKAAETAWLAGHTKRVCIEKAEEVIQGTKKDGEGRINIRMDYVEMNDSTTFDVLDLEQTRVGREKEAIILSGAMWVGKTRLIDNIILGDVSRILG
jgi:pantoate--beta-alanine ligase